MDEDMKAQMLADLGNQRRDEISTADDSRGRTMTDREERAVRLANEGRRHRIIKNAPTNDPRAAQLAAWNDPKRIGGDSIAEQQTNYYDGQGHRAGLQSLLHGHEQSHPSRFESQQDVRQGQFGPPHRQQPREPRLPTNYTTSQRVSRASSTGPPRNQGISHPLVAPASTQARDIPRTTHTSTMAQAEADMLPKAARASASDTAPRRVTSDTTIQPPTTSLAPAVTPSPSLQATYANNASTTAVVTSKSGTAVPPHLRVAASSSQPRASSSQSQGRALQLPEIVTPTARIVPEAVTTFVPDLSDFRVRTTQFRCLHRISSGEDSAQWLDKNPASRDMMEWVRQDIAHKVVTAADDPSGIEAKDFLVQYNKFGWLFDVAVTARSGGQVQRTDPVIEQVLKLTEKALSKEGKTGVKAEEDAPLQVQQQNEDSVALPSAQHATPGPGSELQRADSVVSSTVSSDAKTSRGFFTATYLDVNGNVVGNDRFDVDAPIQVAVTLTASDSLYDPLTLAQDMQTLAGGMRAASGGLAFTFD